MSGIPYQTNPSEIIAITHLLQCTWTDPKLDIAISLSLSDQITLEHVHKLLIIWSDHGMWWNAATQQTNHNIPIIFYENLPPNRIASGCHALALKVRETKRLKIYLDIYFSIMFSLQTAVNAWLRSICECSLTGRTTAPPTHYKFWGRMTATNYSIPIVFNFSVLYCRCWSHLSACLGLQKVLTEYTLQKNLWNPF